MLERLDWVHDIVYNFRGMGWNWRISAVPPPPKAIQMQLSPQLGRHCQVKQYATRGELLRSNLGTLATGYLALDVIKTAMMNDRYFWGYIYHDPPSYLPSLITSSPHMTHAYRMVLSMLGIKFALQCVFSLAPLFFSGVLSPLATWRPRGRLTASCSTTAIAGWWGNWWHQTFRFAFQEPSRKLYEVLRLDRKSKAAKMLQLLIAFFLSGVVHASGSVTCAGDTQPLQGPMAFFLLQAGAIFAEICSRSLRKTWTFVYVHAWFYLTAHLLCSDFARAAYGSFEPVPISILRGVGLGPDKQDGWWCWSGQLIRWHAGETWWKSGLTM
ncbi:membrane bound O-acyl transferase family-domain-containing protein [Bipolaris maydis]|nr:membrane bound O-acyl transferase family-domain-containing protein [Bipolaris maydis]